MDEDAKEIRAQRHDFLKEYYKMATMDLDRHLKQGWQTIAVIAGGAAILSAGHDGKIGLPIAASLSLVAGYWGALSVIDANLWSLRAISFLANVESVYLSVEDRKNLNPYVGFHPRFELMESLKYMFWLCVAFTIAVELDLVWEFTSRFPTLAAFLTAFREISNLRIALWFLPAQLFFWGIFWVVLIWLKDMRDYVAFSKSSPGAGLRFKADLVRFNTFPEPSEERLLVDHNVQRHNVLDLTRRIRLWTALTWVSFFFALCVSMMCVTCVVARLYIITLIK